MTKVVDVFFKIFLVNVL